MTKNSKNAIGRHRNIRIVAPYEYTYSMKVKQADDGKTIHQALADKLSFRSFEQWGERITRGFVSRNGNVLSATDRVTSGQSVDLFNSYVTEPAVPDEVEIIAETDDWLAVYKPAPMPVHPGGRYFKNTLISILDDLGYNRLRIIHRLDAVTSGLVLLGKNTTFTKCAHRCFSENRVHKTYLALVDGLPENNTFSIAKGIRRKQSFVFECSDESGSKSAVTDFEVEERYAHNSLIACYPKTGRTHQLRLHLLAAGYPIADDYIYNTNSPRYSEKVQHSAISLINAGMVIPELNVDVQLPEYLQKFEHETISNYATI